MHDLITVFQLYWSFLKIGFTSFGGLSMIPLITSEMMGHGWMKASEISDIVAIAEMTPGPLGLNCATFAGLKAAGLLGATAANLGVLTPSLSLGILGAIFFAKFKESNIMQNILVGVRPACIAMVIGVVVTLSMSNYVTDAGISLISICIGIVDLLLLRFGKLGIPTVIIISAIIGIIVFGVLNL
ncbi:chromate transporter [Oribacterium sp. WCC10]|uniref:chromate transporter n=1 Tax=Oribacterium sp. WCC10 TaxID=1855343 RepID=UPI0008E64192|nr:chromate transporter [Oribacterium sp. WCC10]SFG18970.1 chromate transporter [Oribacterium sp. WCC10]